MNKSHYVALACLSILHATTTNQKIVDLPSEGHASLGWPQLVRTCDVAGVGQVTGHHDDNGRSVTLDVAEYWHGALPTNSIALHWEPGDSLGQPMSNGTVCVFLAYETTDRLMIRHGQDSLFAMDGGYGVQWVSNLVHALKVDRDEDRFMSLIYEGATNGATQKTGTDARNFYFNMIRAGTEEKRMMMWNAPDLPAGLRRESQENLRMQEAWDRAQEKREAHDTWPQIIRSCDVAGVGRAVGLLPKKGLSRHVDIMVTEYWCGALPTNVITLYTPDYIDDEYLCYGDTDVVFLAHTNLWSEAEEAYPLQSLTWEYPQDLVSPVGTTDRLMINDKQLKSLVPKEGAWGIDEYAVQWVSNLVDCTKVQPNEERFVSLVLEGATNNVSKTVRREATLFFNFWGKAESKEKLLKWHDDPNLPESLRPALRQELQDRFQTSKEE